MKKFLLIGGLSLISLQGFSQNSISSKIHNYYQSKRAMGMGNAFSAVADDYSSMMYNPAQLSFRQSGEIQWNTPLNAGVSKDTMPFFNDFKTASDTTGTDNDKANAISAAIEKYYGKPVGFRISPVEFFWVRPNWGASLIIADTTLDISIQKQLGPTLDINLTKDTSFNYAQSWEIDSTMAVGGLLKINHRDQFSGSYSVLDLALDSKIIDVKDLREGINFDFDIGYTWKPDFFSSEKIEKKEEPKKVKGKNYIKSDGYSVTQNLMDLKIDKKNNRAIAKESDQVSDKSAEKVDEEVSEKNAEVKLDNKTTDNKIIDKEGPQTDIPVPIAEEETPAAKQPEVQAEIAPTETPPVQVLPEPVNNEIVEAEKKEIKKSKDITFSAVLRNLLALNYSKSTLINKDAVEGPEKNQRVLDIGASYDLIRNDLTDLNLNLEFKNIMHKNTSVRKSTHVGLEYTILSSYWFKPQLRMGLNQMYFTAGASINLGPAYFDFVTYAEELGTDKAKIENRVNAVNFGWKF